MEIGHDRKTRESVEQMDAPQINANSPKVFYQRCVFK